MEFTSRMLNRNVRQVRAPLNDADRVRVSARTVGHILKFICSPRFFQPLSKVWATSDAISSGAHYVNLEAKRLFLSG